MDTGNTKLIIATPLRGRRICKESSTDAGCIGFNTVPSAGLFGVFETRLKSTRPSLVYCGNDKRAKDVTARLIRDSGFDPLDAGPLQTARYTEPVALLVGQLAYEGNGRPELAYRFERLGK
jgi:predicted dinucleotide-binding enzyme